MILFRAQIQSNFQKLPCSKAHFIHTERDVRTPRTDIFSSKLICIARVPFFSLIHLFFTFVWVFHEFNVLTRLALSMQCSQIYHLSHVTKNKCLDGQLNAMFVCHLWLPMMHVANGHRTRIGFLII